VVLPCPLPARPERCQMLLAVSGILVILGLLAVTAFLVGQEHLHDQECGDEVHLRSFPRAHSH
jgi:hypothetical protein